MAEPMRSRFDVSAHAPVPFWRDIRVLQIIAQIVFVILVIFIGFVLINNLLTNLEKSNLTIDFSVLSREFGTKISEGRPLEAANEELTHLDALLVGFKNTMRVVIVGLIGATVLGVFLGIGRLSTNFLIRAVTVSYVELFRNTPLLVQLFFIYRGLRQTMPAVRDSWKLPGPVYINLRAINYPNVNGTDTAWLVYGALGLGVVIGAVLWKWRLRVMDRTGQPANVLYWSVPPLVALVAIGWLLAGKPFTVSNPELQGLNFVGGSRLTAEYATLTVGLILYTAAFIADIVRAGIQAVPYGQIEAARAQGFSAAQTLRMIVLPQALRLIIPPLGNQYLNLAKNSSLGIAVAFWDVYKVASVVQNQTSQAIAVFTIMMLIYLGLSLTISAIMNLVNYQMRLRSR